MTALTARDCLCAQLLRVEPDQRYREVIDPDEGHRLFAVSDGHGGHLGIVTERQAALFPDRIFADLLVLRQPEPVPEDADLATLHARITNGQDEYVPVVAADGSLLGVVSELSLFSALSSTERRLREERERLIMRLEIELHNRRMAAGVFDSTSEGILVTDPELRIVLVNKAFTDTTGYLAEEVRGAKPSVLASGRHDAAFYRTMWKAIKETGGWSGEIWNRRRNGEIYPEWLHINVVRDADGTVLHYIGVFSDVTHFKSVQTRLHELAYYDPLTGLPNRQLLYDRLEQAIVQARRMQHGFSLLFIDLDRFKDVNDSLGHGFGDRILIECAQRLRSVVRESDTVARLGGDEFTVILPDSQVDWSLATVAGKIIDALSVPIEEDGRKVFLSASVGITRFPDDGERVDDLIRNADTAMYRAKEEGRGRYCFFTRELNHKVSERLRLETELRESIRNCGLSVEWQPQVRLSDGMPIGAEVLTRWRHPELGQVPPTQFIPVAEECGLILDLGRWVLEHAVATVSEWMRQGDAKPIRIAVNLSAIQLRNPNSVEEILGVLRQYGLPPEMVELELTESALMSRDRSSEEFVEQLGAHGVRFSVDDFGTGYSNLAYLKRFAVHRLKIDRAFVQDLADSETDRQIVSAIVAIGHSLGLKVVAEGVETVEQEAILRDMGCDEAQGYLYSRPISFSDLTIYLEQCEGSA